MRIGLMGCGDIGTRLGEQLYQQGHEVHGYRRSPGKLPSSIQGHQLDVTQSGSWPDLSHFDVLVVTLTPGGREPERYRAVYLEGLIRLLKHIDKKSLKRLLWVSSSSVYGQDDDSWVDESSICEPARETGQILLQAEKALHAELEKASVVRFTGIYREAGHRYLRLLQAGELGGVVAKDYFTNRIHIEDCVGFLAHLISMVEAEKPLEACYLATDSCPVRISELVHWFSAQANLALNDKLEMPKGMAGSKRCSNKKMLETGYQLAYPDYKSGLKSLFNT